MNALLIHNACLQISTSLITSYAFVVTIFFCYNMQNLVDDFYLFSTVN